MPKTNNSKLNEKRWLTTAEMTEYLGMGRTKGMEWCRKIGALKHPRGIKRNLYDREMIDGNIVAPIDADG